MDLRATSTPIPWDQSFDSFVGIEFERIEPAEATAAVDVRDDLLADGDRLHGGVIATAAEALASLGTAAGVWEQGNAALGMSNDTRFLRKVTQGRLRFTARRLSDQPDLWTWQVEAHDAADALCAVSTVSIAVRPRRL